jgi:hypothetical protein
VLGASHANNPRTPHLKIGSMSSAKPRLTHVSNMRSQILCGPPAGSGLNARPSLQHTGVLHVSRKLGSPEIAGNPTQPIDRAEPATRRRRFATGRLRHQHLVRLGRHCKGMRSTSATTALWEPRSTIRRLTTGQDEGAWENRAMGVAAPEQLDEASLAKRLEAQKELVARLISEGKDASAANATLYELSKAVSEIRRKTNTSSTSQ